MCDHSNIDISLDIALVAINSFQKKKDQGKKQSWKSTLGCFFFHFHTMLQFIALPYLLSSFFLKQNLVFLIAMALEQASESSWCIFEVIFCYLYYLVYYKK